MQWRWDGEELYTLYDTKMYVNWLSGKQVEDVNIFVIFPIVRSTRVITGWTSKHHTRTQFL